ncbi:endolytic transglycosylase MltG [Bacillus sp. Marseille-P3661]|uniref:endolytic transglycosylase MltG n=1 Tax=Bacillus sp. Marseille-P3661 TaxID=1936234 RepID=UPI0035B54831
MNISKSDETDYHNKLQDREHEARIVRKIVLVILSVLIIIFLAVVIGGYLYITSALKPVDVQDESEKTVTIPIGSSVRGIAGILEENGLIKDENVFRYYVKFKNESGFQAGDYQLSPSMEIQEIIDQLKTGKVIKEALFSITIPEGKHIEEMATIISKKTNYSVEEIMDQLNNKDYIQQLMEKYPTIITEEIFDPSIRYPLEGYLFPATYQFFEKDPSIDFIIEEMLTKTEEMVSGFTGQLEEKGLTVHKFLTMASLIEEEATQKADREKISSVFYNRLDQGMPLQTDPTVLYSLGKHSVLITYDDLEVDSPYNTYQNPGLPPGPIASPGEMSMSAAVNPSETNYLYFYSRPNGETIFSKSLNEHNRAINQYGHEWDEYKKSE